MASVGAFATGARLPSSVGRRTASARGELQEARLKRGEDLHEIAAWLRIKPGLPARSGGRRSGRDARAEPMPGFPAKLRRASRRSTGLLWSARLDEALGVHDGQPRRAAWATQSRGVLPDATAVLAVLILGAAAAGTYCRADIRGVRAASVDRPAGHLDGSSASAAEVAPVAALASRTPRLARARLPLPRPPGA